MSIVMAETCHYCRRARNPVDIINLPSGIKMCHGCYERHQVAVRAMSGLRAMGDGTFSTVAPPPPECSECGLSYQELQSRGHGSTMAVHFENGLYRMMCMDCSEVYITKRRDLYGSTQFGWFKKLN